VRWYQQNYDCVDQPNDLNFNGLPMESN